MFDLQNDPREEHNLNASEPAVTARLLKRFTELSEELGSNTAGAADENGMPLLLPTVPATAPATNVCHS